MYKIEWKKRNSSIFNELHIDNQLVSNDCLKYVEYANLLEQKLIDLINILPTDYDEYLETANIIHLSKNKWIDESEAFKLLPDLEELISNGELGWTEENNIRRFDINEINILKEKLYGML
jgi:hypothetical protein